MSSTRETHPKTGRCGFTLVEVAFSVASLAVILGAGYTLTSTVSGTSGKLVADLETFRGALDAVDRVRGDLGRARVISVAEDGSAITYSLPVKTEGAENILDADGEIRWGVADKQGSRKGGTCTIRFSLDRIRSESEEDRDINGDGDKRDVFDEGRLVRRSDKDAKMVLRRTRVLLVRGDHDGDIDGDGVADPLFTMSETGILTLRLARPLSEGFVRVHVMRIKPTESAVQP